jgi:probable HAF family extracellular repeat protein
MCLRLSFNVALFCLCALSAARVIRADAFLWTPATGFTSLGSLGGNTGGDAAAAINGKGEIVGIAATHFTPTGSGHAFLWTSKNGMQDLGSFAGPRGGSVALGITLSTFALLGNRR